MYAPASEICLTESTEEVRIDVPFLLRMLTTRRPHGSSGERIFVRDFVIGTLQKLGVKPHIMGPMENIVVSLPLKDGTPSKTLFSCHTDTVHGTDDHQSILYDENLSIVYKPDTDKSPLGADDGAGVWLCLSMIKDRIPGTYVFHRGEERGGVGSMWMAEHREDWLSQFDRAVAFDRKGNSSVITEQFMSTCCSDEFAEALAAQLGIRWKPDPTGIFTDTANYVEIIPECTNISVGYEMEHTPNETLDVDHLEELADLVRRVDWENLPTERDPELTFDYRDFSDMELNGFIHRVKKEQYVDLARDYDLLWNLSEVEMEAMVKAHPNVGAYIINEAIWELREKFHRNWQTTGNKNPSNGKIQDDFYPYEGYPGGPDI